MKFIKKVFLKLIFLVVLIIAFGMTSQYIIKENFFPYKYKEYVDFYSNKYDLDPLFVLAVIKTESKFNDDAQSHKNAVGLMQITVETGEWAAKEMGYTSFLKDNLYDEEYNISMGCWYLRRLKDTFNEDLDLTIAAYNAGPTNVRTWLENEKYSSDGKSIDYIPFGETKKYVDKVNTNYQIYKYLYNEEENNFKIKRIVFLMKSYVTVHFLNYL